MSDLDGLSLQEEKEEDKKPEITNDSDATQALKISIDDVAVDDAVIVEQEVSPQPVVEVIETAEEVDILPEPAPPVVEEILSPASMPATGKATTKIECMPAFVDYSNDILMKNPAVSTNIACPSCSSSILEVDEHFSIRGKKFTGWLCQKCNALYQNDDGGSEFIGSP